MNRCLSSLISRLTAPSHRLNALIAAAVLGFSSLATFPAYAQVQGGVGLMRNFPDASMRGNLVITGASDAMINGQPVRMAPGMRLFSPQNTLVMAHQVLGREFVVNYLIENSTGMLLSAWILTAGEATVARKGSGAVITNYRSEYDESADTSRR
jgi:hypothetical protein